jgi:hypothetical protein
LRSQRLERLEGDHPNAFAAVPDGLEIDEPIDGRKQGMVSPDPHVITGLDFRPALAYKDVSGADEFAAEFLDPQPFRITVSTVAAGTAAFFVCHELSPENPKKNPPGTFRLVLSGDDFIDLQPCVSLPVTGLTPIAVTGAVFENQDLAGFDRTGDGGFHVSTGNDRGADLNVVPVGYQQHLVQLDRLSVIDREQVNVDIIAFNGHVLFAAAL